ncbi:MAG TPA: BsuPI-related putative proteinase inhibitor [Gemmatirosa sp.]|nr:BsuPI-related putative proteinase inhibitor [Gemmatirosa sp.]
MSRSLVIPLIAAAVVAYACGGPRPHAAGVPVGTREEADSAEREAPTVLATTAKAPTRGAAGAAHRARGTTDTASVQAALAVTLGDAATFALQVVNVSDRRLELDFPDGQTRDFTVYDAAGREVWRWSKGRLFTQVMQNKLLHAGDTVTYAERWERPAPGTYQVLATLRSENHPVALRAQFTVPEATKVAQR